MAGQQTTRKRYGLDSTKWQATITVILLLFMAIVKPDLDENAPPKPNLPHGIIQPSKCYTRQAACITIWLIFYTPWKTEETKDASLDQIQTHPWASGGMFSLAIGQHAFQLPNRVQKVPSPLHQGFGISHPVSPQHIIPNKLPIRPWPYSSISDYPLQTGWTNLPFRTFHCKRHTQIVCNFMPSLGCQLLLARTDPCCEALLMLDSVDAKAQSTLPSTSPQSRWDQRAELQSQ